MLEINIRDRNKIITLVAPGKTPLQGRRGSSPYYYNSLDYLLAAAGTCIGGEISDYCRFNDLNPQIFENIYILFNNDKIIITITRPKDFDESHIDRIVRTISNCTVSKYLKIEIEVQWGFNETPTKELVKNEQKGCCGQ